MTPAEQKVRRALPFIRWMQAYVPMGLLRWLMNLDKNNIRLPEGISRETVTAAGVPCEWLIPEGCDPERVLLYLHGGGFVFGWTQLHREMVSYLAKKMGVRALAVDYRLAPDFPFPAALDDCVAAYRWLLKQGIEPQNITLAGDSAGGNLTITTLMKLRDSGDALPAVAACLSPVINLTERANPAHDHDEILHPRAAKYYRQSYTQGSDPATPLISPQFGDWHGLPPLLIHAGEAEFLSEDATEAEKLAQATGVAVSLKIYPRMWHVWQLNLELPASIDSLAEIARFLSQPVQKPATVQPERAGAMPA